MHVSAGRSGLCVHCGPWGIVYGVVWCGVVCVGPRGRGQGEREKACVSSCTCFVWWTVELYAVCDKRQREKLPVRELNPGHPRDRRVY